MTSSVRAHGDVERLLEMINANWMTQAVGVAAELRIADALSESPKNVDALAVATSTNPASLRRLMRALESLAICMENAEGAYEITKLGTLLKSDVDPSIRAWAIWSSQCQWQLWGGLLDSVKTGESARKLVTGRAGYDHLVDDSKMATVFYRAMIEITRQISGAVARGCDLSCARRLVDIGGGHGELLVAVLNVYPRLKGVLFDLPHAVDGARSKVEEAGLADRCEIVGGSFFESVPAGADVYMLKSILHNWDDEHCAMILSQCRRVMAPGARLLVIERVMPEQMTGSATEKSVIRSDLNMMVGFGGRERTRHEFATLLALADFELQQCDFVGIGFSLIQARAH